MLRVNNYSKITQDTAASLLKRSASKKAIFTKNLSPHVPEFWLGNTHQQAT